MKKLYLFVAVLAISALSTHAVYAAKSDDTCAYIKDGTIKDRLNNLLSLGNDKWGYNYQAHIFNGYLDNSSRPVTPVTDGVWLQMKWNDAWLSNKDCGTQGTDQLAFAKLEPDGYLDRHYPLSSYEGSGAWLTNHVTGSYTSAEKFDWDVSGNWVVAVNGGAYNHDYTFTMTSLPDGTFTGVGGYPAGAVDYSIDETVVSGKVTGSTVVFTADYYINGVPTGYSWTATGIIDSLGHMSGTGTSGVITWQTTIGAATKVYKTCKVSDFVKIVAVPTGSHPEGDTWISSKGEEIGKIIWGDFAIIQEESSDPCGEYGVINYQSPLRKGLGNWGDK